MPDHQQTYDPLRLKCWVCERRFGPGQAAPVPKLPHRLVCSDCAKTLPQPAEGWRDWYIQRYGREPEAAANEALDSYRDIWEKRYVTK